MAIASLRAITRQRLTSTCGLGVHGAPVLPVAPLPGAPLPVAVARRPAQAADTASSYLPSRSYSKAPRRMHEHEPAIRWRDGEMVRYGQLGGVSQILRDAVGDDHMILTNPDIR